ncbi:MAG: cytochrome c biogenesis protein DipZ, partial [Legionellales bacterium]
MYSDFITLFLGFAEGFALILSPCILPILPIFLAGSLSGSKQRPLGIIIGFTLFFALIAFFSRQFVQYSGIDLNLLRTVSFVILFFMGVVMMSQYLSEGFARATQGLTQLGTLFSSSNHSEAGFINGIFFGGLIALI